MKKIVSVLLAVLMVSTVAFGADYSITNQNFDRVADEITVNYSGSTGEYMTVFVYDVTRISGANESTPWDVENTPIIGLDQAIGNGTFNIKVKSDFTGKVVIVLGGEYGNSTKVLLDIVNGIPSIIDAEYNAGGDTAVVGDEMSITISGGNKLLNAKVLTTGTGVVEYTNNADEKITLTGDMSFGEQGEIDALSGKTVVIKSENADSTYDIGYINKLDVIKTNTLCTILLTASGAESGSVTETFELDSLEGEVRVRSGISNVPDGVTISQTITIN